MKVHQTLIFALLLPICLIAQKQKRSFMEAGLSFSYPLHDDMIRSHRIITGISGGFGLQVNKSVNTFATINYTYYWPRRHFPDSYEGSEKSKKPFSITNFSTGIRYHFNFGLEAGIGTGPGIAKTMGYPRTGIGWVEEYDGQTVLCLVSNLTMGYYFNTNSKNKIGLIMNIFNIFAEQHAENYGGLIITYGF